MDEFYVRSPNATSADGPFSVEQLQELYKAEMLNEETLFREIETEGFAPFSSNEELWNLVSSNEESEIGQETAEDTPLERKKEGSALSQFFFLNSTTDEVQGPYTLDQFRSLAAASAIGATTPVSRSVDSGFKPLAQDPIWERIRPQDKPVLRLKKKEPTLATSASRDTKIPSLRKKKPLMEVTENGLQESPDIDHMLKAAEGNTRQTKHVQSFRKSRERAFSILLPGLLLSFLLSAAAIVQPFWETLFEMIQSRNFTTSFFLKNWILVFVVIDVFLALAIGFGKTAVFPFARLRCGIGIGFFLFLFYSRQEWTALVAMTALQSGIIGATLCTRFATTLLFIALSVGGGVVLVRFFWF
ncbi:MAG: hypothetical protein AAGJ81_06515 [Verrucomicrobiota bacterium]